MSSEEDLSSAIAESESISESFGFLKAKFLEILDDHFFHNLQHDWRDSKKGVPDEAVVPSYHSLSEESGSFLVLDGFKISYDWFRSALKKIETVPEPAICEPKVEKKVKFVSPYTVKAPEEVAVDSDEGDRLHTHRSRARQGMRNRLMVENVPFEEERLGTHRKYPNRLATQLDPHIRSEISYRPRIRNFMRVSAIHQLREDSRRQFETFYRQEYLFEKTEAEKAEKQYHKDLLEHCSGMTQALREIRQQRFSSSMRVLDMVKPCYEETARLEGLFKERKQKMVALWNDVIQLESIWKHRIVYQNFLYLIMPKGWREEYDWIHRDENGELESFPESIAKRSTANLRELKGTNDIWAVKKFFEEEFLAKDKPVNPAFEDCESLMVGIAELDVNSITLLSRLNLMNWALAEVEKEVQVVQLKFDKTIKELRESISDLFEKKRRCEERSANLKHIFEELVDEPLRKCVYNEKTRTTETLLNVMYKDFLPPSKRSQALWLSGVDCVKFISNIVVQLLADLDRCPPELLETVEKRVRKRNALKWKKARKAAEEDRRNQMIEIQLKRALAPPYIKPPRKGKLPRSRLKKKIIPEVIIPPKVTKLEKIFALGFGKQAKMTESEQTTLAVDLMFQNYCTVQFDQFLRTLGYEPDYDFVPRVQQRDGPETNFIHRKEMIPLVMHRVKKWEDLQQALQAKLFKSASD
ncbi:uncharacterized protein LOC129745768 [Uranotaenia lowii]|uniref:uncharacterized protein LOC129745768 n=1 Tax=Uranotaenia lowii TaxID=190385 RepID=UPI00247AC610|nr:uncharacterized protein LOC129745768 [Uranotaenia lowii]